MRTLSLLIALFTVLTTLSSCSEIQQGSKILNLTIWHTELDPEAGAVIEEVARATEDYFRENGEVNPIITVSALRWGDVATRIFQESDNLPDITHLQPFMVKELYLRLRQSGQYELYPLDDAIERIENDNADNILPSIKRIHRYKIGADSREATFGLAYAVGTTFIAYRADWNKENLPVPKTWDDLVLFADELAKNGTEESGESVSPFILPGRSPFFIDQLTNEILVSIGGSLYRDGRPNIMTDDMEKVLWLMQEMIARTNNEYSDTNYQQQFTLFAEGKGAVVPVTYGRATKQIDQYITDNSPDNVEERRRAYAVMMQPGSSGLNAGVASIDAEPWVIIKNNGISEEETTDRLRISEKFLEFFYSQDFYPRFTASVPVHLRPILRNMSIQYDSLESQVNWKDWAAQSRQMLESEGGTAPILMDPSNSDQTQPSFILSLQLRSIISEMVTDAAPIDILKSIERRLPNNQNITEQETSSRKAIIKAAIERGNQRASQLYEDAPKE